MNYSKLHILADFDGTLTKPYNDQGVRISGIIALLRINKWLGEDYAQEAQELFDYYRPLEHNPSLTEEEKIPLMEERRTKLNKVLIKYGLSKSHIQTVVDSGQMQFREGWEDFFTFLKINNIPLTIYSAAGIGTPCIEPFLRKHDLMGDNIHIISNDFNRNEQGKSISIKGRIMHTYNKDTFQLSDYERYDDSLKKRNKAIILGDSLGDLDIGKTGKFETITSIGFLNKKNPDKESFDAYNKAYDHLLSRDDGFKEIVEHIQ